MQLTAFYFDKATTPLPSDIIIALAPLASTLTEFANISASGSSGQPKMASPEGGSNTGATASESQPQGDGQRNRGRGRGKGNQNRRGGQRRGRGGNNSNVPIVPANPAAQDVAAAASRAHAMAAGKAAEAAEDDDGEVCFICANPVAHHSIAPCNHTTCHICGLRMRALYKTKDCAHCRVCFSSLYPGKSFIVNSVLDPSSLCHLYRRPRETFRGLLRKGYHNHRQQHRNQVHKRGYCGRYRSPPAI